jgi:hypothetical protein
VVSGQVQRDAVAEHPALQGPITFSVNPGDCVTVSGFNLNGESYVTISTEHVALHERCSHLFRV